MMAFLLAHLYEKLGSWKEVINYYDKQFKASFDVLHSKILEDGLFNDITNSIGPDNARVIVPLLDLNQKENLKALLKEVK